MLKTGISVLALLIGLHGTPDIKPMADAAAIVRMAEDADYQRRENEELLIQMGMYGALSGFNAFTQSSIPSSLLESVQQVSISLTAGNGSNTGAISAVTTTRTSIHHQGETSDGGAVSAVGRGSVAFSFASGTSVNAERGVTSDNTVGNCVVVQWAAGVTQSVQYGTSDLNGLTQGDITISAVTAANAGTLLNGVKSSLTANGADVGLVNIYHNSTTVIRGERAGSSAVAHVFYACSLEFVAGVLNSSTQQAAVASSGTVTNVDATISAVTLAQTMLGWCGSRDAGTANHLLRRHRTEITSTTNIKFTRSSSSSNVMTGIAYVFEFKSQYMAGVDNVTGTWGSGETTHNEAISAVAAVNKCIPSWLETSSAQTAWSNASARTSLTTTTNEEMVRAATGASSTLTTTQIAEFV